MVTGYRIKTGKYANSPIILGDIIKGNQTHEIVVKQRSKDGKFVGKILNPNTKYAKEMEQDEISLDEFLTAWSTIEIIGNINIIP